MRRGRGTSPSARRGNSTTKMRPSAWRGGGWSSSATPPRRVNLGFEALRVVRGELIADMMRNTFWAILGDTYPKESDLPPNFGRIGHYNTTHPGHPERWTTISHLFNGHYDLGKNRLGMNTFRHDEGIAKHDQFFQDIADAGVEVDTLLINSGLHDCWLRPTPEEFVDDFAFGWEYYMKKFREIEERQADGRRPQVIYRYSNTPPYHINAMLATPMNPQSMEMLNLLERDYLESYNREQLGGAWTYLDSYEVTWPWHFDGEMNTGPHYGR